MWKSSLQTLVWILFLGGCLPSAAGQGGEDPISVERAEQLIEEAYLDILNRHPDPSGLDTHVDLLREGMRIEDIRAALAESDEGRRAAKRIRRRTILLAAPAAGVGVFLGVVFVRSRNRKEFVFKTILLLVSVGAVCGLAELGLRIQANWRSQKTAEAWKNIEGTRRPNPNSLVTLKDVIHLSSNSDIVYELFPHLSVRFLGKAMQTDESGFRITPGSEEGPEAFRIVGLGDSVMFGWGVADHETYLAYLCEKIKAAGGEKVTVWNTAVPGYNTTMETETMARKMISRQPDLVLLHYVENDLGLPNFIPQKDESLTQTRSYLVAAVSRWRGGRKRAVTFDRLVRRKGAPPEHLAHMVGEEACIRELKRLHALSAAHGFDMAVICNWSAPEFLASTAEKLGIPIIELGSMIKAYREEHNIETYMGSVLTVARRDSHFSALAHELVANEVFRRLKDEGLLPEE